MKQLYLGIGSAVCLVVAISIIQAIVQLMQEVAQTFYSVTAASCMIFTFIILVVAGFQLLLITDC